MSDKQALTLRAQEIINSSPNGMTTKDAMKQALRERYANDPDGIFEVAASLAASTMKGLRKRTFELGDNAQLGLFAMPTVIGVRTTEGDLLVARDQASAGHIKQWQREGQQHHATQHLRFKRLGEELKVIKDVPDEMPWVEARRMLPPAPAEGVSGG